jgi:hypothetical protein
MKEVLPLDQIRLGVPYAFHDPPLYSSAFIAFALFNQYKRITGISKQ